MIPGIAINQRYGLTVPVVRSINRLRLHEVVEYPAHQREERAIAIRKRARKEAKAKQYLGLR